MRAVVADDHEVVRRGVRAPRVAPGLDGLRRGLRRPRGGPAAQELRPDVVVLDLTMPEMNGLEAIREIRASVPDTEVIPLTVHDSDQLLDQAPQRRRAGVRAEGRRRPSPSRRDRRARAAPLVVHLSRMVERVDGEPRSGTRP